MSWDLSAEDATQKTVIHLNYCTLTVSVFGIDIVVLGGDDTSARQKGNVSNLGRSSRPWSLEEIRP
ncbi:hypothetical protein GCM10027269_42480 [Kribbella endophytica]